MSPGNLPINLTDGKNLKINPTIISKIPIVIINLLILSIIFLNNIISK